MYIKAGTLLINVTPSGASDYWADRGTRHVYRTDFSALAVNVKNNTCDTPS